MLTAVQLSGQLFASLQVAPFYFFPKANLFWTRNLGLVSEVSGSQIILCTDGVANIGLGRCAVLIGFSFG